MKKIKLGAFLMTLGQFAFAQYGVHIGSSDQPLNPSTYFPEFSNIWEYKDPALLYHYYVLCDDAVTAERTRQEAVLGGYSTVHVKDFKKLKKESKMVVPPKHEPLATVAKPVTKPTRTQYNEPIVAAPKANQEREALAKKANETAAKVDVKPSGIEPAMAVAEKGTETNNSIVVNELVDNELKMSNDEPSPRALEVVEAKVVETSPVLEVVEAKVVETSPVLEVVEAKVVENYPALEVVEAKVVETSPVLEVVEAKVVETSPVLEVVEAEPTKEAVAESRVGKKQPTQTIVEERRVAKAERPNSILDREVIAPAEKTMPARLDEIKSEEKPIAQQPNTERLPSKMVASENVSEALGSTLNFGWSKSSIDRMYNDALSGLAEMIKSDNGLICEIHSFSDDNQSVAENLALSKKRADAVVGFLLSKGVKPTSILVKEFGGLHPKEEKSSSMPTSKRVEFHLYNTKDGNVVVSPLQVNTKKM